MDQLTYTFIKVSIVKNLGFDQNGIYQCAYNISNNYINIFFMTISVYYLPVLSAIKEKTSINKEINNVFRFTIFILFPIITFSFTLRYYLINIFYSNEFLPAQNLLFYIFIGDIFKALTWVLGMWLITTLKIKVWIIIDFIYFGFFNILFYIMLYIWKFELYSATVSYTIACIIKFIIDYYYLSYKNNFVLSLKNKKMLIVAISFISIIFIVSNYNIAIGYIIIIPSIIFFNYLTIDKVEISEIKRFILNKIGK